MSAEAERRASGRLRAAIEDAPASGWPAQADHGRRRLIVALAAAVLVVAVGTASAIGSVREFILDRGFIGLPPMGASPSSPENGELVVQWMGNVAPLSPTRGFDMVDAWVYADGRIIWVRRPHGPTPELEREIPEGANKFDTGYLEQRLAPEGVKLVRGAVAELLDRSGTLVDTIPALDDPWGGGHRFRSALFIPSSYWAVVAAPRGDRLARLWAVEIGVKDAEGLEGLEGTLATPEQLSALRRVDALLSDLLTNTSSVLPPSAWAMRKARAYVPAHYAACIDTSPPKEVSQVLSMLPARAAGLLRDTSRTSSAHDLPSGPGWAPGGRAVTYCFKVETPQAREVAEALSGLEREPQSDSEPRWENFVLAYRVAEAVDGLTPTRIWFEPYFPDGRIPNSWPSG